MEPIMWLILLACFLVVEAITVGLTTIWFAGGALVAAIASGLGAGILIQWVLFLVISLVLLIFTQSDRRKSSSDSENQQSGADRPGSDQ